MKTKEAVIILSYYFPPCNLTPSERVYSWAKYLQNGNYYPIIITRNWDIKISNSTTDAYKSSGKEVRIEKHDNYEVHYLPYKATIKDRLFLKFDGSKWYFIYLAFALVYSILQLAVLSFSPYINFYHYTLKLLLANKDIQKMVVSASPYELFGIADNLHTKTGIKWIADYRDDWSTSALYQHNSFKQFVNRFNTFYEKKWLKSCSSFMTVSNFYVSKIGAFIRKEGEEMTNGYLPENYQSQYPLYDFFTITYVGSIYETQPIELFLNGILSVIRRGGDFNKIRVNFVGIKNEPAIMARIEKLIRGFENNFCFTERIDKVLAIEMQAKSHLLLLCSHSNLKGIPGSKLYEYIALKKHVIVYPTDNDIVEATLSETKQGLICRNESEFVNYIDLHFSYYINKQTKQSDAFDNTAIKKYSREEQTYVLINALNNIS